MGKRIRGVLMLLVGLLLTVFHAVKLAYRIPSNFTAEGEGMVFLVNLVEKYDLQIFIPAILFGVCLSLSGVYRLISPRMRRVSVAKPVGENASVTEPASPTASTSETEASPDRSSEDLICSFRTHLMGATFKGANGKTGRAMLAELGSEEPLMCRMAADHQFPSSIGVYTLQGQLLGYLDDAFVRELEGKYPNHRISVAIDRMTDREDTAFRCLIRVGVYESQ